MAQYISVKRKQQINKHAPLAFMLCLLFLFSSFTFSFADSLVELPIYSSGMSADNGILLNQSGSSNNTSYASTKDDTFLFFLPNSNSPDTYYTIGMICSGSGISAYSNTYYNNSWHSWTSINTNNQQYDSEFGFYFLTLGAAQISIVNSSIPYYTTSKAAIEATFNSLTGGGSWSGSATVSVEAGCVAYILVDGGTATLSTTFPELSKLSRPLWTSGSTYSFENDLPSSGKVFSSSSGTLIDWLIPASAKTDLLGRSYQGGRPLSDLPSGQYLVVYNPVYRGYDDKGVGIMSPTIYVSLSNYGAVRQYRLTASYNGGLIESTSDDGYSSWFDSIGEEELDANGNPLYIEHLANGTTQTAISIPSGGGNIVINGDNADNSIGGLLERLLSLLTAPIKYIERLYNSAVQFFDYLSSLWGWLPVEVTSIIGAALAVLVVIGVVKFLWK